ncbi:leucine-rich repeat flightless-interacting protein 1 isoform X4 [Choloepus didactylus]|uniref:leucine-rich repeat flightless-interacting protein 1 isoform X4 n=1 Tax=Choloepus didactylus TaxID=27675 RepID=UPI00189F3E5B|nr:leucine-rich repeat flightless-interacting protein 1 isoform X4 [Choloepus didactylus]
MCRVPVPTQGLLLSGPGLFRREGGDSGALGRRRRAPQPAAAPSPGPGVLSGVLDGADLPVMRGRIRAEGRARRFLRPGPRLTGPGYLCSRARRGGGRAGCAQRALREAVPLAGDAAPTTPGRAGARCSAGAPGARVRGSRRGTRARLSRAGLVPRTRGPAPGDPAPQGPSCAAPAPRPRTRAPAGGANWAGFVPRLSGRGRRGLGDWSPCPGSRAGGGDRDCGRGTCAPGGAGAGRARGGRGGGGPGLAAAPPGPGHLRPAPPAAPEPGNLGAALGEWLLVPGLVRLRGSQSLPAGCGRAESRVCGVVGVPCGTRLLLSRGEKSGAPGEGMTDSTAMQNKEIDCLSPEAQKLAEARLAAKRAARAEAREIRMKELERQQKEIYQVQKKYYGLDTKWGDIEQWMEDSERYSRRSRRTMSASDEDERVSTNGYDGELYGPQSLNRRSGRKSSFSGDGRFSTWSSSRGEKGLPCSDLGLPSGGLGSRSLSAQDGIRASALDGSGLGGARWSGAAGSHAPSDCSGHLASGSRASSRASSARASPVVEERPEKDFTEKGSRNMPSLSAATLASLGGTSSRRGSGDTSISIDTEASIREIKELNELKDQIQDVEGKYMQGLKEMKDALAEVEEKYKKAMVSNAQLDNEKTNFMYQVDTLKDVLLELEEQLAESRRQYEEKNKEFEREKHAHSVLQFQFAEVKEALKQREEMLEEIRQLQQKQASYTREISDLQETVEWKDKKIGALERQKEFFDSVRSERDDLREEVAMLKEELKKHGIILNSEIATNGETSGPLNDVGYQGFTKMTKEELSALTATGDGTLGRASEVAVKSEMVENVGQREILQNTEQEPHKEDTVKDCVDTEVLHPGESAEDQSSSEDSAPSPGTLANAGCEEQVQGHILEHPAFPKNTEQIQSDNVVDLPGDRTTASLEQNRCLPDLESEIPGPLVGQSSCNDLGIENGSKESAEMQEKENQEDFKTNLGEVSAKPCQGSVPLQLSEVERVSSAGTGGQPGSPTNSVVEAGGADVGEQVSTRASSSPERSDDPVSCGEKHGLVDAPQELDPSTAHSLEKELATQDVAEPKEAPMQRENSKEEDGETELMDERPSQPEVKTIPSSPAAQSDHQEAASARMLDAESGPLDPREPGEGKSNQQGEVLDSSPKKTKSKKKKNKKKKSPVPVETLKDVAKELTFQNTDLSEVKEEEQETFTDKKPAEEAQGEVAPDPNQDVVTGISENVNCPENPKIDLDGKLNQEDDDEGAKAGEGVADGDMLDFEDGAAQPPSPSGGDKELDEGVIKDNTKEDGADQICPPEPKNEEIQSSTLLENESPPQEINGAPQIESNEKRAVSEHPGHAVEEALDSINLEDADSPAPAGEVGDLELESKNDARSRNEKGRSKEDCTMS